MRFRASGGDRSTRWAFNSFQERGQSGFTHSEVWHTCQWLRPTVKGSVCMCGRSHHIFSVNNMGQDTVCVYQGCKTVFSILDTRRTLMTAAFQSHSSLAGTAGVCPRLQTSLELVRFVKGSLHVFSAPVCLCVSVVTYTSLVCLCMHVVPTGGSHTDRLLHLPGNRCHINHQGEQYVRTVSVSVHEGSLCSHSRTVFLQTKTTRIHSLTLVKLQNVFCCVKGKRRAESLWMWNVG